VSGAPNRAMTEHIASSIAERLLHVDRVEERALS
jgi:hypothetical protein